MQYLSLKILVSLSYKSSEWLIFSLWVVETTLHFVSVNPLSVIIPVDIYLVVYPHIYQLVLRWICEGDFFANLQSSASMQLYFSLILCYFIIMHCFGLLAWIKLYSGDFKPEDKYFHVVPFWCEVEVLFHIFFLLFLTVKFSHL